MMSASTLTARRPLGFPSDSLSDLRQDSWSRQARIARPVGRSSDDAVHEAHVRLTAKQYTPDRKRVAASVSERVFRAVQQQHAARAPIHLVIPFGCYKHPALATAPECDWAEYLHLDYMLRRAADVAEVYAFGVELSYLLLDLPTTELVGLSAETADRYYRAFSRLLDQFRRRFPRVALNAVLLSDILDRADYEQRMGESLAAVEHEWRMLFTSEQKQRELAKSARNRVHVAQDDPSHIERAAKLHLAFLKTLSQLSIIRGSANIPILLRRPGNEVSSWLPMKSCRTSVVQFWVGSGCIVRNGDQSFPTILSRSQMASKRLVGHLPVSSLLNDASNLRQVAVYEPR